MEKKDPTTPGRKMNSYPSLVLRDMSAYGATSMSLREAILKVGIYCTQVWN